MKIIVLPPFIILIFPLQFFLLQEMTCQHSFPKLIFMRQVFCIDRKISFSIPVSIWGILPVLYLKLPNYLGQRYLSYYAGFELLHLEMFFVNIFQTAFTWLDSVNAFWEWRFLAMDFTWNIEALFYPIIFSVPFYAVKAFMYYFSNDFCIFDGYVNYLNSTIRTFSWPVVDIT